MKLFSSPLTTTIFASFFFLIAGGFQTASAQGLLGIGQYGSEINETVPLKVTAGAQFGYDSNTNTASDDEDKIDSFFYGGGLGLFYAFANENTRLDIGGNFAALYYEDSATNDDVFYNTRFTANLGHQITRQMRLTNNAMVAYEIEPDYLVAASTALRDDQYLFFYNRTALWYGLTPQLSSVTSYTIQGVDYESGILSAREDRLTHLFGQQMRYALSAQTSLRGEYRYGITDFDRAPYDSTSHYVLGGFDHRISNYTEFSVVGGAEYRKYDQFDSFWKPYAEAGVRHRLSEETQLRWMGRVGLEDNEVFGFQDRFTYRTGLSIHQQFSTQMRGHAGISYIHSDFNGGSDRPDVKEDAVSLQAGLAYQLLENVEVHAGYYFTTYSSDDNFRDYDRHRVTVGATGSF